MAISKAQRERVQFHKEWAAWLKQVKADAMGAAETFIASMAKNTAWTAATPDVRLVSLAMKADEDYKANGVEGVHYRLWFVLQLDERALVKVVTHVYPAAPDNEGEAA